MLSRVTYAHSAVKNKTTWSSMPNMLRKILTFHRILSGFCQWWIPCAIFLSTLLLCLPRKLTASILQVAYQTRNQWWPRDISTWNSFFNTSGHVRLKNVYAVTAWIQLNVERLINVKPLLIRYISSNKHSHWPPPLRSATGAIASLFRRLRGRWTCSIWSC